VISGSDTDLEGSPEGRSRGRARVEDDASFRYSGLSITRSPVRTSRNDTFARNPFTWPGDYAIAGPPAERRREEKKRRRRRRKRRRRRRRREKERKREREREREREEEKEETRGRESVGPKESARPGEEEVPSSTSIVLRGPRTTEAHEATSVRL